MQNICKVVGGRRLSGEVTVQGAKNAVLPILAAAFLFPGVSVIRNCPLISDVEVTLEILRTLGCKTIWEGHDVAVDASFPTSAEIPDHLMRKLRSSVIFLGAILARLGEVHLSYPGG